MNVIVVGAGRLGTQFAGVLAGAGNNVTVLDIRQEALDKADGRGWVSRVLGDGCEPAVLEEAGVHGTDLLVAATGEDEDNLVISLLAKRQFEVARVVARINEADNAWLFNEHWGVDVDTVSLIRLGRAGVSLIETVIGEHSPAAGRRLTDVAVPARSVVAAVIRAGAPTVPPPDFVLRAGDELIIVARDATEEQIRQAFQ
jgi:trk system potassium uptake protein TrkA